MPLERDEFFKVKLPIPNKRLGFNQEIVLKALEDGRAYTTREVFEETEIGHIGAVTAALKALEQKGLVLSRVISGVTYWRSDKDARDEFNSRNKSSEEDSEGAEAD